MKRRKGTTMETSEKVVTVLRTYADDPIQRVSGILGCSNQHAYYLYRKYCVPRTSDDKETWDRKKQALSHMRSISTATIQDIARESGVCPATVRTAAKDAGVKIMHKRSVRHQLIDVLGQANCLECGEVKPISEFYHLANVYKNVSYRCKVCNVKKMTEFRKLRKQKSCHAE
jgi:hypothetical protein